MGEETHKKIKHPLCPKCGKPMRIVAPINMAICDECGEKYYVERQGDEYIVLGSYYEVKAQKLKEEQKNEQTNKQEEKQEEEIETDWIGEGAKQAEEPTEEMKEEMEEEKQEEIQKTESDMVNAVLPTVFAVDTKYEEFKEYVEKYVNRRYWVQVAKEELKKMVSELYDAGALGNNFNPSRVARVLTEMKENAVLPFYGVEWLDRAVTKELLTRIWLKLQGYKEIMRLEKLKYYIAIYHPEDIEKFLNGELPEITVKKYIYEMESLESGQ